MARRPFASIAAILRTQARFYFVEALFDPTQRRVA
jgi:hypothetical protein